VAAGAGAAAVVLLVAGGLWIRSRAATARVGPRAELLTLAVLPIENVGGDSATEYLADGLTGELSRALKNVPGVQVAGDLSTSRFKGTRSGPAEIARQLGVIRLLSGKLQPGNRRVRLQIELTDTTGASLWSGTFNADTRDNFAMQDTITAHVANELKLVLTPATLAAARSGRTINPDAHLLYLRGQFEKNKVTEVGLRNAITYFTQALALDSNYAQAHAGMAFAYDMLADAFQPSHEYHTAVASTRLSVRCRWTVSFPKRGRCWGTRLRPPPGILREARWRSTVDWNSIPEIPTRSSWPRCSPG
jgi:TolB-like protein